MLKNFLKFSLGAVAIIAFGAALYFAASYYKEWKDKNNIAQQQKPDEIIITELPNGEKLVKNKTEGVSVKVPKDWFIDNTKNQFYSSGSNEECKISSEISKNTSNETLDNLKNNHEKDLSDIGLTIKEKKYQIITVSSYDALKFILNTEENGYFITVEVPVLDKIYSYILYSDNKFIDNCNNYFDKFLQTISIK